MNRGEVRWANLAEPAGSGPGYKRPVIIVQSDAFNKSRISTVVAVVITSNLRLAAAPGNVKLEVKKTGLDRESIANVSQIITLDKQFLEQKVGQVDYRTMGRIDEGIRLVLAL